MSKVINISQCITEIDSCVLYDVPVLFDAVKELVAHRELRGMYVGKAPLKNRKRKTESYYEKRTGGYCTNRNIKTWACFFLLKAMTSSGKIHGWTKDKKLILTWCQCNENTFRRHLAEMKRLKLCTVDKDTKSISLVSYENAAAILGITYTGTYKIKYNPYVNTGKQLFQYILRAEDFRQEQQRQLEGLTYHLNKNPLLRNDLHLMLLKYGADDKQLNNPAYFQQRLLSLQMHLFQKGSDILSYVFSRRADINRSGGLIKEHHQYKSKQSVSYLQKRMAKLKVVNVQKIIIESECRSRLYIPDGLDNRRDGYKWLRKKSQTAWFLTLQISFNYDIQLPERLAAKKAA